VLETTDVGSLLYMLYLANDVVQNKRAGGADVYMGEFKRVRVAVTVLCLAPSLLSTVFSAFACS
jgi:hypothetical protein